MTRRRFLIVLLIIMLLVLASLVSLFVLFRRAAAPPAAVASPGFRHVRTIYGWGNTSDKLLDRPFSVAYRNGSLYVSDKQRAQVIRLSTTGQLQLLIGARGDKPGQLTSPTGVEADAQGNVYVTDPTRNRIVVFDAQGRYQREVSLESQPLALFIDGTRMFVTTVDSLRVLALPGLEQLAKWGTAGKGTSQWDHPNGITYDPLTKTVYVGDGNNLRVKAMDDQGNLKWVFGQPAKNMNDTGPDRKFGLAGGVAFANGYLFVADPMDSILHILDPNGNEVAQLGDVGLADGQFGYPTTITYMGGKQFAIVEWGNGRVQIVEIDAPAVIQAWRDEQRKTAGTTTTTGVSPAVTGPTDGTSATAPSSTTGTTG
ncbi:MAG: 6-bladed beta-propeller [Actinobacteria bacterium]|nr:6-bladed beta-propeller [Actinomycetota bacterium]